MIQLPGAFIFKRTARGTMVRRDRRCRTGTRKTMIVALARKLLVTLWRM